MNFFSFYFLAMLIIGCSSDDGNNSCGVQERDVILIYQKDVDEFAKCNYTSIEGSLYITDDAYIGNMEPLIKDISGLSSLTSISGDIGIKNIVGLTFLYGLQNIETCKSLDIIGCKKLANTGVLQKLKPKGRGLYYE